MTLVKLLYDVLLGFSTFFKYPITPHHFSSYTVKDNITAFPKGYELRMSGHDQTIADKGLMGCPLSKPFLENALGNPTHNTDLDKSEQSQLQYPKEHSTITVGVVGLGCIGLPLTLSLSNNISVIGFDRSSNIVSKLNNLVLNRDSLSGNIFNKMNLHFTDDPEQLEKCNFIIITVSVPFNDKGEPNPDPLMVTSQMVGEHLQNGTIVVYECLLYPGATEEILIPALEKYSSLKADVDFHVGYSSASVKKKDKHLHIISKSWPDMIKKS